MYNCLSLTKTIVDNHIKDFSLFKFSYFWGQSTTFMSVDDAKYFLFEAKKTPESIILYEKSTKAIAGLLLLYPSRLEYKDATVVILIKKDLDINHKELAKTVKTIITAKFKKADLFCMRSTVLTSETDQIKILEMIGFEKEVHMKEQVYYDFKYNDAYAYTLFRKKL